MWQVWKATCNSPQVSWCMLAVTWDFELGVECWEIWVVIWVARYRLSVLYFTCVAPKGRLISMWWVGSFNLDLIICFEQLNTVAPKCRSYACNDSGLLFHCKIKFYPLSRWCCWKPCTSMLNHAPCCKLVFLDEGIIAITLKGLWKPQSSNTGYENHNENPAMLAI